MLTVPAHFFEFEASLAITPDHRSRTERSGVGSMRRRQDDRHEKWNAVANTYKKRFHHLGFILLLIALHTGCHSIDRNVLRNQSPLKAIEKQPTQTELEVVFVRIPSRDQESTAALWKEVDELAIDAQFRRELNKNGFRVGVIGSHIPTEVQNVLKNAHRAGKGNISLDSMSNLQETHAITRKLYMQPGQQSELLASSVQKEFQMLELRNGSLVGETLRDGQAQFVAELLHGQDDRVLLRLTPEVHFGAFRNEYVPGEGMFRLDTGREKKRLHGLQLRAELDDGQILIVGPRANQPGSLGHQFFNQQATDQSISKLMMIRICEIATDNDDGPMEEDVVDADDT